MTVAFFQSTDWLFPSQVHVKSKPHNDQNPDGTRYASLITFRLT